MSQSDPYLTGTLVEPYHPGDPSSMSAAHGYPYPLYEIGSGRQTPRAPDQAVVGLTEEYQPLDNASARLGSTRELEMHDGRWPHRLLARRGFLKMSSRLCCRTF